MKLSAITEIKYKKRNTHFRRVALDNNKYCLIIFADANNC